MSNVFVALAVVLAMASVAAPPAKKAAPLKPSVKALPIFEFQGETTKGYYDHACAGSESIMEDGSRLCFADALFVGRSTLIGKTYWKNKLSSVYISFKQDRYPEIMQALLAKYGQPDSIEVKEWQSRGGVKLDNSVSKWLFDDGGLLQLEQVGSKIGDSRMTFDSKANAAPAAPAKVDF